jgi:asparagine synthase (glutamine-hydrolysing)
MGFGVPLKHWFRGDWQGYARDLLLGRRAVERGFLDPAAVGRLLDAQADEHSKSATTLYALVALEEWCRAYLDSVRAPTAGTAGERKETP